MSEENDHIAGQYEDGPTRRKSLDGFRSQFTRHRILPGKKLTAAELEARKGDRRWCQVCLKRRVNRGYKICFFCS